MTWAIDRRLDYIDWSLATRGTIQRGDLVRVFNISLGNASADLQKFLTDYPTAATYDRWQKSYVPARKKYRRQRQSAWTKAIDWRAAGET